MVEKCSLCEGVIHCFDGYKGKNADEKKILFVLNHADVRIEKDNTQEDYLESVKKTKSGIILGRIMEKVGLNLDKDIYLTNIFKGVLPYEGSKSYQMGFPNLGSKYSNLTGADLSRKNPSSEEYRNCVTVFNTQVGVFKPERIVLFGMQPAKYLLSSREQFNIMNLKEFEYMGFRTLVSYHPSKIWALRNEERISLYIDKVSQFLKDSV